MTFCRAPFTGITIDPAGNLNMCCSTANRRQFNTKISDIEDLGEFFLDTQMSELRQRMESRGLEKLPECKFCSRAVVNGLQAEVHNYNRYKIAEPLELRYLEVTTSNVCNQTCATCNSYFSTKWRKIEKHLPEEFQTNAKPSIIKTPDIDKILNVLPQLHHLNIKGGEPFADKNNLRILNKLVETNPTCEVIITSNFQNIPDEWWEPLSKLKNLIVGASIDGTGRTYDWIRSGNFENTYTNIQKFTSVVGYKPSINMCISIYNLFNLKETTDFFKGYTQNIYNVVYNPEHLSPNIIDSIKLKRLLLKQFEINPANISPNLWDIPTVEPELQKKRQDEFLRYTDSMNKIRGFNIFDIHPQLAEIF